MCTSLTVYDTKRDNMTTTNAQYGIEISTVASCVVWNFCNGVTYEGLVQIYRSQPSHPLQI